MIDNLFRGLFDTDMTVIITPAEFLTCLGVSLGIGLILAALYQYHTRYTRSFVLTLALLPAVVCVVIMMVNGNVGTGVAVAGTFSLVRFRSAPGTAREICAIFLAMAAGLIAGMGYLGYAVLCTLVLGGAELLFRMLIALSPDSTPCTITVLDADGTELFSWDSTKNFSSVLFSSPELEQGAAYTVTAGANSAEVTLDTISYRADGIGGGMGGGRGGSRNPGERPDQGTAPDPSASQSSEAQTSGT